MGRKGVQSHLVLTPEIVEPSGFDRFWQAYPRRLGKAEALKAWGKLKPDTRLLEAMLSTLTWQLESPEWTREGGRFIPHPTTWLNQHRWEDEPPEVSLLSQEPDDVQNTLRALRTALAMIRQRDDQRLKAIPG